MSGGSQFSSEVPKGDGWGVDKAVADAVKRILAGEKSPLIPVVGVIDIKTVKIDPETHNLVPVVRVRRIESLDDLERIRQAQRMLLDEWAAKRGEGAVLPFEERELIERAFGDVNIEHIEQDEAEAAEEEDMDAADRLRKHMNTVHGHPAAVVEEWDDLDVRRNHHEEHEGHETGTDHDEEWWEWRRVVIAEAMADALNEGSDSTDDELAEMTGDGDRDETDTTPGRALTEDDLFREPIKRPDEA